MTSSPHNDLGIRSRVARFVQLVIGVPTAISGVALLILASVLHHDYQIPAIALGELGAVLLSLSILHLLYERLLREEYNRETVELLKRDVYPKFEAFAPLADAQRMGITAIHLEPDVSELFRWLRTKATTSVTIIGVWQGYEEASQQLFIDLANSGRSVDFYISSSEFIIGRRREDISGEKDTGSTALESSQRLFKLMLERVRPEHRDKLRLWGYPNLPNILLAQADSGPIIASLYMLQRQAPEAFSIEIADSASRAGRMFAEQIQLIKQQSTRMV